MKRYVRAGQQLTVQPRIDVRHADHFNLNLPRVSHMWQQACQNHRPLRRVPSQQVLHARDHTEGLPSGLRERLVARAHNQHGLRAGAHASEHSRCHAFPPCLLRLQCSSPGSVMQRPARPDPPSAGPDPPSGAMRATRQRPPGA